MTNTQQVTHSMKVKSLKNLTKLEIDFEPFKVTAILGPNGNGKSTILHALACAFSPNTKLGEDYKFSKFFLPSTGALWQDSELSIEHSYREGKREVKNNIRRYKKTKVRWTPRYSNRPKRDVFYIGIDKCVPMIEMEKKQAKINYSTKEINESIIEKILEKASYVLNRQYLKYHLHNAQGKEFIGVEVDGLNYSALSMSAGEQKVFYILEKVFKADIYSLILVDELDLLLHDDALRKLIEVINERAIDKKLQIVFTTHRESVLEFEGEINIRHVINKGNRTFCFNETKPDAITRLTGKQISTLDLFVEDDLAEAIIRKIASQLGIARHISVTRFGAADNCFTVAGGLLLGQEKTDNILFILDGDVYISEEAKIKQIQKSVSGNDTSAESIRAKVLKLIKQFNLPSNTSPEEFIHSEIKKLNFDNDIEAQEIVDIANEIQAVSDNHFFINGIINKLGYTKVIGIQKIVDLFSKSSGWKIYSKNIHDWLDLKKSELL